MNFESIKKYAKRPELYAKSTATMWDDPHVSKYMLEAHLNPEWDAASRRPQTIDATITWMQQFFKPASRILDLGCGPGLYTTRLAKLGYDMVGMDFSKRSVTYAKEQAEKQGLAIQYLYQNYLTLDYEEEFDAVTLIYCDFGALTNDERDELLKRIHRALKPGGVLIFDVFNERFIETKKVSSHWSVQDTGFWTDEPHIVLEETIHYPEASVFLDQYVVWTESDKLNVYRNWDHYYTGPAIQQILRNFNYRDPKYFNEIIPAEAGQISNVMIVVTQK